MIIGFANCITQIRKNIFFILNLCNLCYMEYRKVNTEWNKKKYDLKKFFLIFLIPYFYLDNLIIIK